MSVPRSGRVLSFVANCLIFMYRVKFNESQVLGLDVAIGTRLDAHAGQRAQVVRVKTGSYQACSVIVDDHREQAQLLQGISGVHLFCARQKSKCRSEPARDGGLAFSIDVV